jgi:hypothetical protein
MPRPGITIWIAPRATGLQWIGPAIKDCLANFSSIRIPGKPDQVLAAIDRHRKVFDTDYRQLAHPLHGGGYGRMITSGSWIICEQKTEMDLAQAFPVTTGVEGGYSLALDQVFGAGQSAG